jgi:hypothetical protein
VTDRYLGLQRLKSLLDTYLAALADEGRQAIDDALQGFLDDHPEVLAVGWYQGAGLSHLTFELTGGATYLAAEDQIVAAPLDHTFDPAEYAAFADLLHCGYDVLLAKLGYEVTVRATRAGITALPMAA